MTIYLDCAATTPMDSRALELMMNLFRDEYGNPGSYTHRFGIRARSAVEHARDAVAAVVRCRRSEVVFTSGATESNNLAIFGLEEYARETGRRHIVSTQIEHNAVLEPIRALEKRGFSITLVPPTSGGWIDPEAIREALRPDTLLVSVMHVNNETGVRQPLEEIAGALADHPAFLHVDSAQGFGKEIEPLRNPRIDLISASGHKIYGPKGIGALIARRRSDRRSPLQPLMFGGGQEQGLRPGTLPAPLIAGFGKVCELALTEADSREERCHAFKEKLLHGLSPLQPMVHGDPARTVSHFVNLSIPGVLAEEAMDAIEEQIAVSNGSACTSHSKVCSHVLAAMGVPDEQAAGALRFSWCHETAEPEWGAIVKSLKAIGA